MQIIEVDMKIKINSNSREEKMNIAKAEMDKVNHRSVKSAKDATCKNDKRLSTTTERYKGYLIVLDRGGDGYNVYDKHRELEDAGYPSRDAAKRFIDELVDNEEIYSAISVTNGIDSSSTSEKYWYFTRHGVQPGLVPKYINILDIKDVEDGSYFLADGVIKTEDLKRYEIKEKKPEKIYSYTSFAQDGEKGYLDTYETIRFEYDGPAEIYESKKGMEMYLEDDDQFKDDSDDVYKDSEYGIQFADAQAVSDAVDELIKDKIPQTPGNVNVHIVADLYFDIFNIYAENTDLGYDWQEERRVYDTQYDSDDLYTEFNKDKSKLIEFEIK